LKTRRLTPKVRRPFHFYSKLSAGFADKNIRKFPAKKFKKLSETY